MTRKTLHPENELLTGYLLGRLASDEEQAVERHLTDCAACTSLTLEMQPVDGLLELLSASAVGEWSDLQIEPGTSNTAENMSGENGKSGQPAETQTYASFRGLVLGRFAMIASILVVGALLIGMLFIQATSGVVNQPGDDPRPRSFALLVPSSLGDDGPNNYTVDGEHLRLDANIRQVWLNFNYVEGHTLELNTLFRFLNGQQDAFLKIAFLKDIDASEYNVQINWEDDCIKATICEWRSSVKTVLATSGSISFPSAVWADLRIQVTSTGIVCFVNDQSIAEYSAVVDGPRCPAIAALNCVVELRNPRISSAEQP